MTTARRSGLMAKSATIAASGSSIRIVQVMLFSFVFLRRVSALVLVAANQRRLHGISDNQAALRAPFSLGLTG